MIAVHNDILDSVNINYYTIVALIIIWYTTSAINSSSSKSYLDGGSILYDGLIMTWLQFLLCTVVHTIVVNPLKILLLRRAVKTNPPDIIGTVISTEQYGNISDTQNDDISPTSSLKPSLLSNIKEWHIFSHGVSADVIVTVLLLVSGSWATNAALCEGLLTSFFTYKCTEPIFTLFAGYMIDRNQISQLTIAKWMGMLFVSFGIWCSSFDPNFSPTVLIFSSLANFLFGIRTIILKRIITDNMNHGGGVRDASDAFGDLCVKSVWVASVILVLLLALQPQAIIECLGRILHHRNAAFISALMYYCYNSSSTLVLARVKADTHTLMKSGKVMVNLFFGMVFLSAQELGLLTWVGIYITLTGYVMYCTSTAKSIPGPDSNHPDSPFAYWKLVGFRCSVLFLAVLTCASINRGSVIVVTGVLRGINLYKRNSPKM